MVEYLSYGRGSPKWESTARDFKAHEVWPKDAVQISIRLPSSANWYSIREMEAAALNKVWNKKEEEMRSQQDALLASQQGHARLVPKIPLPKAAPMVPRSVTAHRPDAQKSDDTNAQQSRWRRRRWRRRL